MSTFPSVFDNDHIRFRAAPIQNGAFPARGFSSARARISDTIRGGGGKVAVIGTPGVGKTTLLRTLMRDMEEHCHFAFVWNPSILKCGFAEALADCLGTTNGVLSDADLERGIEAFIERKISEARHFALVVDEAQALASKELDRLLGLADKGPARTVLLSGQPTLERLLTGCRKRNDVLEFRLERFSESETTGYIRHRMHSLGGSETLFDADAMQAIFRATQGTPRKINDLCDRCLLIATRQSLPTVSASLVEAAQETTGFAEHLVAFQPGDDRSEPEFHAFHVAGPQAIPADFGAQAAAVAPEPEKPTPPETLPTEPTQPVAGAPLATQDTDRPTDDLLVLSEPDLPVAATAEGNESVHEGGRARTGLMFGAAVAAGIGVAAFAAFEALSPDRQADTPVETARNDAALPEPEPVVRSTPPVAPRATPPTVPLPRQRVQAALDALPADPDSRFRHAVAVAAENPLLAVAAYSQAALAGHARAAYYLGQMFEAGDGVPRDTALAAAWYRRAAESLPAAAESLAALGRPDRGAVSAPVPLVGRVDGNAVELSWISGTGPDPHEYRVEFASHQTVPPLATHTVRVSASKTERPVGAERWRVLAMDSTGARVAASDWHPLEARQ